MVKAIRLIVKNSSAAMICCLLFFCFSETKAQVNYVRNPSLEDHDSCPDYNDEINYAHYWSAIDSDYTYLFVPPYYDGYPEYLNVCALDWQWSVPQGMFYYHYARTGEGMAQVYMFYDESYTPQPYKRDYLQGRFYKPLIAGKNYCVTFYVALEQASGYAINKIGAYLDDGIIDTTHAPGLIQKQYTPQIVENEIISDTLNWTKIEGSFTAAGTERFITIGNYLDSAHTAHIPSSSGSMLQGSLYLVDDISVIESDAKAYAWNSDTLHKGYMDSILIGRDEIIPGIQWYRDGVLIDTLHAGIWIKDDTLGSYHTYILAQTLCGLTTYDTVVVSVEMMSSGIRTSPGLSKGEGVSVYPNPFDLSLTLSEGAGSVLPVTVKIYDVVGREVYSSVLHYTKEIINTSSFSKGTYFVEIRDKDGGRLVRKIVKE